MILISHIVLVCVCGFVVVCLFVVVVVVFFCYLVFTVDFGLRYSNQG